MTIYILHLRPKPGNYQAPPERRLKALLKVALRAFGFRCVGLKPVNEGEGEPQPDRRDGEQPEDGR